MDCVLFIAWKRSILSEKFMMMSLLVIALGLVIGSFLNVVIYRLPRDESVVSPGSHCPSCNAQVQWYQNIPLFSYLFLGGKCANCKAKISWRYPLVELITALLFFAAFKGFEPSAFSIISQLRIWVFISICIAITFIDFDHRIIPDELSLGGWAFGALTAYWDFRYGMVHLLVASVCGFGFFFLFALIYEKLTGRVGLGGGDIKFMGTIGVFLGGGGIWASLILSSIIGSIVGISLAWYQKRNGDPEKSVLRAAIPYGPFLVFGALIELFFEVSSRWIGL
jgi:leader peptidase (prepilin peptidase)/N-methyltransferase